MARKETIISGTKKRRSYRHIALEEIVGRTIEAIAETTVEGNYDPEPCVVLCFTDGTKHGFVLPSDDD